MSVLHEAQNQLGWHHRETSPEEYVPLNPVILIDAALTEVSSQSAYLITSPHVVLPESNNLSDNLVTFLSTVSELY